MAKKLNPDFTYIEDPGDLPNASINSNGRLLINEDDGLKTISMDVIHNAVQGVIGVLKIEDPAPTVEGKYDLADIGEYENLVPIIAAGSSTPTSTPITTIEGFYNAVFWDGTNFTQIKTLIQNSPIDELDYLAVEPVNSKAVLDFLELETYSSGDLNEYSGDGFGTQSIIPNYTPVVAETINQLAGYFNGQGVLLFHIVNDKRDDPDSYNLLFTKKSTHSVNVSDEGYQKINFSDIQLIPGDYIAIDKNSTALPFYGAGTLFSAYQVSGEESAVMYGVESAGLDISIQFNYINNRYVINNTKKVTKINVVRNVGNYNSIRNTISAITDNSENNQYEVHFADGVWPEYDLKGKPFVKLIGASKNAVIFTDPLGTMAAKLAPSDCSFPDEAGKRLDAINQNFLHCINLSNDFDIENLTLYAKNCKYPAHLDNSNYKNFKASNVYFKAENCNFPVGIGFWSGQKLMFEKCFIHRVENFGSPGVFAHNWSNQAEKGMVNFSNCKFINCGYAIIDELGSNQNDEVNFINCFTDISGDLILMVGEDSDGKTFWTNPATSIKEANPVNVPYNISVTATGTKVDNITSLDSGSFNSAWTGIPQRDVEIFNEISIISK